MLLLLLALLGSITAIDAAPTTPPLDKRQTANTAHDYIFVGGGTAGLVAAYRIAEANPNATLLILEAGQIPFETAPASRVPAAVAALQHTSADWNYTATTPAGVSIPYTQGRALSGSSGIGWMAYSRGPSAYYNTLAQTLNDSSWSWENMSPLFDKATASNTSTTLPISFPSSVSSMNNDLQSSLNEAFSLSSSDDAGSSAVGTTSAQRYTVNPQTGWRETSWTSIGQVGWGEFFNMNVLSRMTAQRLILASDPSSTANGALRVNAVTAVSEQTGELTTYTANRRVILSAGVIGTPRLLLLSGIGSARQLQDAGITSSLDLPGVGQNLHDQPTLYTTYTVSPSSQTNQDLLLAADPSTLIGGQTFSQDSAYASPHLGPSGYIKSSQSSSNWADIEISSPPANLSSLLPNNTYTISLTLSSPFSRGNVSLASSSPSDAPVINTGFLSDERDHSLALDYLKQVRGSLVSTGALGNSLIGEISPGQGVQSDQDLNAWMEQNVGAAYRGCGTASMGTRESAGVVDTNFQVFGTSNLHVVDMSVIPSSPPSGTMALAYAVGEKGARAIGALDGLSIA